MPNSRNEYLKSLNRMRANYQSQGNPLINKEDDNGNVGEEMSSFAYMDTNPIAPEQTSNNTRNGWQRTVDTVHSGVSNVTEGVTNFLDDVWDFTVVSTSWLTGLFSGIGHAIFDSDHDFSEGWQKGTEWTQPATTFEWEHYLNQWWNQMDVGHALLSGDAFTGDWAKNWADMGDAKKNKENLTKTHQNSWANEWGDFGQGVQNVEQGVGYVLPSLVLAYFTGGSSLGAQAAIQAGVAGAGALGGGFEQASKEGASYGEALGYGATKGAISAGTTAILMGVGGSVASKTGSSLVGKGASKVGEQVFKATGSKGAEVFASKAVEVASRAGFSFGSSFANQAVEPYIKSIYDDGNAIAEAYESDSKARQYLERCATNATLSAVTTALVSAGREGVDFARRGSDGYMANYYSQKAMAAQKHISDELKSINKDLSANKITPKEAETRLAKLDRYNETVERYGNIALDYAEKIYANAENKNIITTKDGQVIKNNKKLDFGSNKDVIQRMVNLGYSKQQTDMIRGLVKSFSNYNWNNDTGRITMNSSDGATSFDVNPNGDGTITTTVDNQTYSLPISVDEKGNLTANITNRNAMTDVAVVLGSLNARNLPVQVSVTGKAINLPNVGLRNFNSTITFKLSTELKNKISSSPKSGDIIKFLDNGISGRGKDNYVMQSRDGTYAVVEPYKDGVQKYGLITINNNNEITNIDVKNNISFAMRSDVHIVPKVDVEAVRETKAIYRTGSRNPLRVYQDNAADYDGLYGLTIGADGKWEKNGYFINSKKPFYATDLKKNLPFNKVSKAFDIPKTFEKTYEMAVKRGVDSALRFISKYAKVSPNEVVFKLGYDSYINEKTGKVIIKDGSRIITEGGSISGRQEEYSVRDLSSLGRDISDYTKGELKGYLGENGRGIEKTQDRFKYAQVIKENKLYETKKGIDPDKPVKVIPAELYTKDMNNMAKFAKSLDCELYYAVGVEKGDGELGFYNNDKAVVYVDGFENVSVNKLTLHELTHHLFRSWFAENNLNIISQIKAIEYKSMKMRELVAKYRDMYKPVPFSDYYEELACQLVSRNEELGGSLEKYQTRLINRVNELIKGGKENATQPVFDRLVAEENEEYEIEHGKYYAKKPETREEVIKKKDNQVGVGIAVTYELTSQSTETIKENVNKYRKIAYKKGKEIASLLGLDIKQRGAIGGWTWTDNKNVTTLEGEPSFPVTVNNAEDINNVKLFSALMADTALEVQNSVGVFEYTDSGSDFEDTIYLKKVDDKLYQTLKSLKVEGFTLYDKEKRLVIAGANDDTMYSLITELRKDNNYANWETTQCNIEWLGLEERSALYKTWLKTHNSQENRRLYAYIKQAQKINQYIIDNSTRSEEGYLVRNEGILSNAEEITKEVNEPKRVISDIKGKSSTVLIEAGADVSKSSKVRLNSVREAFEIALNKVLPPNGDINIQYGDIKQSFAELNLAKLKDMNTAIDNIMKRMLNADVNMVDVFGGEKYKVRDLLTQAQQDEARDIMLSTLKGKAVPTKLAQWAKSLSLEKLEKKEIIRHTALRNRIERRIASSKRLNFGYGDAPITELTVFENILNSVPKYWDNKGVLAFADSVLANYNYDNIGKLFDKYSITYDENINDVANNLKEMVVVGKHLDPRVQALADDVLQLLYNNLEIVDSKVRSDNVKMAEKDANVIQSMYHGRRHDNKVVGTVVKAVNAIDNSVTSPVDYLNRKAEGTELQRFVNEETGLYENKEIRFNDKYDTLISDIMNTEVKHLLNEKITFKGEKITYGVALDRINSYKTLGEKFFNSKGTITNPDGTRSVLAYSSEDMQELENAIPAPLKEFNEKLLNILNKDLWEDISKLYKEVTHTQLQKLEDSIWYNISRVSDNFFGVNMGGKSFRDMNLSMFNKRVNSRADINFNMDVLTHVRNYYQTAFKTLVWQPYVNKINTLLNTRVYGVTNYKIYQENLPGFADQMDLLFHQITGVPFEKKVSTLSSITGKVIGNLNAVRVATIQTGLRTLSSAPYFAKYFGGKVGLLGVARNVRNGDILSAKKNYDIIVDNSDYFKRRFSSEDVFLAQTGLHIKNKLTKIFGTPVRWGDASVHLTLGFAMAQVKAEQEGYGAPYTESNNKRAVFLLEQASKGTQPTNSVGHIAGFRYGNGVQKYLFGLYGSMKQAFYDGLVAPVEAILTSGRRIRSMESAIAEHDKKIEEYTRLAKEAEERMNNATDDDDFKKAKEEFEKNSERVRGHRNAKKNAEENLNNFKKNHTTKKHLDRLAGALGGLIFASLSYVAINYLIKAWEGKKDLRDVNIKDLTLDTLEQSFINSLPYASTIYSSIKNNTDLSIATADNINNTIDAIKSFVEAVEKQDGGKITGATLKVLEEASMYFGIPLASMLKLVNGTWYNIDRKSNLDTREWLGMLSGTKLRENYKDAYKSGNKDAAIANLEVWTNNYSIPTSKTALEEIYRLNNKGISGVAPTTISKTYTDESGNTLKYSSTQVSVYRDAYKKADDDVVKLIDSSAYKSLDDEYKGKAIAKTYSVYKEYASAKRDGVKVSSKLAGLLEATNGDMELAKYIAGLQQLSTIKEDEKKSRKEKVIEAINKMAGFTKGEKLLLAYLSGYSVSDSNKNRLLSTLRLNGFSQKDAKAFLGIE